MRRRLAVLLLLPLLLPALLLSGCVSVPFAGGVDPGGPIEGEVDVDFDFLPSGPSAGATQEEILRGFLAATTAAQDNYRIARSFLAEDVADAWNPYDSTLVRAREGAVERLDDATLTYSVPIVASVDAVGRYSVADSTSSQTLPAFRFVQEGGEWRIAELGDGIPDLAAGVPQRVQPAHDLLLGFRVPQPGARPAVVPDPLRGRHPDRARGARAADLVARPGRDRVGDPRGHRARAVARIGRGRQSPTAHREAETAKAHRG